MTDLRPVRVTRTAVALALLAVAFMGVARTTGSGWLLVLLSLVAGVVAAGVVLPALVLHRLDLAVSGPRDGMVGRPLALTVDVRRGGPALMRVVARDGEEVRVDGHGAGVVEVVPSRRGLLRSLTVEAQTAAPLGLVTWRRRLHSALPILVEVAPVPLPARRPLPRRAGMVGVDNTGHHAADDSAVRSVREYSPGDPLRLVHWPATAKTGEVMVRQLEAPASPRLAVVVDLRHGEEAAGRSAGLALDALRHGVDVVLLTAEADGPVVAPVTSALDVGRRLARAVATLAPPEGPIPDGADVVRVQG